MARGSRTRRAGRNGNIIKLVNQRLSKSPVSYEVQVFERGIE